MTLPARRWSLRGFLRPTVVSLTIDLKSVRKVARLLTSSLLRRIFLPLRKYSLHDVTDLNCTPSRFDQIIGRDELALMINHFTCYCGHSEHFELARSDIDTVIGCLSLRSRLSLHRCLEFLAPAPSHVNYRGYKLPAKTSAKSTTMGPNTRPALCLYALSSWRAIRHR